MENENIIEQISKQYYLLTASEKKVADYVLANLDKTPYMSISELAAANSVAEATVSRFCRSLGCKGYNAFRLAISKATIQNKRVADNPLSGEVTATDSLQDVYKKLYNAEIAAITQTMELLDPEQVKEAARLFENARLVLCMGQGASMLMANEAANLFRTVDNRFFAISDSHQQAVSAAMMDSRDVLIYFSYSGATKSMMQTLQIAKRRGNKTILVTRFPKSPGAKLADVVLQCGANENSLQAGSVAARIAQMYLLDILFSEFTRQRIDECREFRARIANAMTEKYI